jgi:hypothetical protein
MSKYKIQRLDGAQTVYKFMMVTNGANLYAPMLDDSGNKIAFSSNPQARAFIDNLLVEEAAEAKKNAEERALARIKEKEIASEEPVKEG